MAQQRRGKTQARRSGGSGGGGGGLPGWAWLVIGVALTLLVVVAAPRLMKPGEDGFWRNSPKPNPDAQPQTADEEAVVDEEDMAAGVPAAPKPAASEDKPSDFDFYTLLPGKEVPVSDAELAASEKAEQAREQAATQAAAKAADDASAATPAETLPKPVDADATAASSTPATPPTATPATTSKADAPASESARYILQAGAFQASGQAEELKAKIALLGVGARVESAQIGGKTVYRVRMGPYGTASELAEAKRKLAGGGLDAMAVKTN
ncbi:SPOR domain-containing protein [Lysobacter humi (ex Lee et al. 2017)]